MYPSLTPIGSGSIFASSSDCCWECLHLRDPLWDQLVHSLSVSLGVILGLLWAVTQEPLRSQEMDSFRGSVSCRLQSLMGVAEAVCMPLGLRWVWEGVLPWGLGPRSWPIQLRGWLVTHSGPLCSCNQLTQWILGTFIKKKTLSHLAIPASSPGLAGQLLCNVLLSYMSPSSILLIPHTSPTSLPSSCL